MYTPEFIEEFVLNPVNHLSLRLVALGAYLEAGLRNYAFFQKMLKDINQEFRRSVIQNFRKYEIEIRQEDLTNVIRDRFSSQDVLSHIVKLIYDLIKKGIVSPSILEDKNIYNHSYWLIRADAISAIIDADSSESVKLLSHFTTTTYWKSRRKIFQYLIQLYEQNRLIGDDLQTADHIVQTFIQDGKSSEKVVEQMQAFLTLLRNLSEPQ